MKHATARPKPEIHSQDCTCWHCLDEISARHHNSRATFWQAAVVACLITWALIGAGVHCVMQWLAAQP